MRSITVELLRYGSSPGILRRRDRYLATAGSLPVRECETPLDEAEFLDLLSCLRYERRPGGPSAKQALRRLGTAARVMLQAPFRSARLTQIDLVASAAELWAFPFETISGPDGRPLLLSRDKPVVLTRRMRQSFASRIPRWPGEPRILFAHASPPWAGAAPVPAEGHKEALRKALRPWIQPLEGFPQAVPDERNVLRILDDASLRDIQTACREARDGGKPYTHVHVLAHGLAVDDAGVAHRRRYALALQSDSGSPTFGEDLARVLRPVDGMPAIVTLAACDAANETNSIVATGSIAQRLHRAGIPVVVASQLPLTYRGSEVLAERFYSGQLAGQDVRATLHEVRCALSKTEGAGHDWASLVAYVQLPEGYDQYLIDAATRADLASLQTAQCWSDFVVQQGIDSPATFDRVDRMLVDRIAVLRGRTASARRSGAKAGVLVEMAGLLGSAYKRLAELRFLRAGIAGTAAPEWHASSRDALGESLKAYIRGSEHNLSHHWTAVQRLSLEAVLRGKIRDPGYWHAALKAAEIDWRNRRDPWAQGSIAELCLLAFPAGQADLADRGCTELREMRRRADSAVGDRFVVQSTTRQLRRYTRWWITANGYFPGRDRDLSATAERMLRMLG